MSERSPDTEQRALFFTNSAAWRLNKMLLALRKKENSPAAIAVATEQRGQWESGRHPPNVDSGTGHKCIFVPPASIILAYLETLAVQAAFNKPA